MGFSTSNISYHNTSFAAAESMALSLKVVLAFLDSLSGDLRSKSLDEMDNMSVHELGVEQPAGEKSEHKQWIKAINLSFMLLDIYMRGYRKIPSSRSLIVRSGLASSRSSRTSSSTSVWESSKMCICAAEGSPNLFWTSKKRD